MREGRLLKNQTCETGLASSMCPCARAHLGLDDSTPLVADDAAVLHALVLAAVALQSRRPEDLAQTGRRARLEGPVVEVPAS